jgi:hypothetical protein
MLDSTGPVAANGPRVAMCRLVLGVVSLSLAAQSVSCRRNGTLPCVKVQGEVQYQDRLVSRGMVLFHPVEQSGPLEKVRPYGYTDATGRFQLTTYEPNDGCPAGEYRVTVVWPQPLPGQGGDDEHSMSGPDRLKGKYAEPLKSGLTVTVLPGQRELQPFRLR